MTSRFTLAAALVSSLLLGACVSQGEAMQITQYAKSSVSAKSVSKASKASVRSRNFKAATSAARAQAPAAVTPPEKLKIPVLVYHHIRKNQGWGADTWSAKMSISPEGFEKQMQWLQDRGYTTIDLDTYSGMMKGEMPGPAKPVVITFDDNHSSQYVHAVPSMEKRGYIGVFYIIAKSIGVANTMTKEQLKELSDKGHDIQSHTMTHRVLPLLGIKDLEWEFAESAKILSAITGKPVRHLAYPGTSHNATVREQLKKSGYVTGSIMDPRVATVKDDFMKVPRIMMIDATNLEKYLP